MNAEAFASAQGGGGYPIVSNIIPIICENGNKTTEPAFIVTRMQLSRATWCASKHPKANVWELYPFRQLALLASKYPAFPSMPFPPPLFFLFLFSCLYQNHLHLYCMFKLFTYLVFQCFINKKMMRFRRKKRCIFFADTNKIRIFVIQKTRDN